MSAILDDYFHGLLDAAPPVPTDAFRQATSAPPQLTPEVPKSKTVETRAMPTKVQAGARAAANTVLLDDRPVPAVPADRWLIFHLGGQDYAFQVTALQEVLAWPTLTIVPRAPRHVLGLIHRRGAVIPVIDIRHLLGLYVGNPTPGGALVLLSSGFALAVDAIGDVFIPGDDCQAVPAVGKPQPAIRALSHHAHRSVILLDGEALSRGIDVGAGTKLA